MTHLMGPTECASAMMTPSMQFLDNGLGANLTDYSCYANDYWATPYMSGGLSPMKQIEGKVLLCSPFFLNFSFFTYSSNFYCQFRISYNTNYQLRHKSAIIIKTSYNSQLFSQGNHCLLLLFIKYHSC